MKYGNPQDRNNEKLGKIWRYNNLYPTTAEIELRLGPVISGIDPTGQTCMI